MTALSCVVGILSNVVFMASVCFMFFLATRSMRENYEARSILSCYFMSERIVNSANKFFQEDPEFIAAVMKQHEEVKDKVIEIKTKHYKLWSGVQFKPKPVYDLKFPREVDGKMKLMVL